MNEYQLQGQQRLLKSKWFSNPISTVPKKQKKKNPLKVSESQVQKTIIKYLKSKNIFCWRNNTGVMQTQPTAWSKGRFVRFGEVGSPDIIAVIGGIFYGIECKSSTGKQSDTQKSFQRRLEEAGGIYILARSLDDVTDIIF